jgi:hypothetical protein
VKTQDYYQYYPQLPEFAHSGIVATIGSKWWESKYRVHRQQLEERLKWVQRIEKAAAAA